MSHFVLSYPIFVAPPSGGTPTQPVPSGTIVTTNDTVPDFGGTPTIQSAGTGNWSSTATWSPARVPTLNDVVKVNSGHTVTYDVVSTTSIACVSVASGGILTFSASIDTKLTCVVLLVYAGGELRIGTVGSPIDAAKTAEIIFADVAQDRSLDSTDPSQYSNGLLCYGTLRVCGAVKVPFVRLSTAPTAGATSLSLAASATGWRAGDRLLLPDSRHLYPDISPTNLWPFTPYSHRELPVLASGGGTTTLAVPALTYAHPAAKDADGTVKFNPHVANLTRNVIFRSANPDGATSRGHIFLTGRCDVDMQQCLVQDMGRTKTDPLNSTTYSSPGVANHIGTNQVGRYPVHLHHAPGPFPTVNTYQHSLIGVVVDGGDSEHDFKWGLTVHDTSYSLIQDYVVYNMHGYGIGEEEGSEVQNTYDGCFVCRCKQAGRWLSRGDDRGGSDIGWEGWAFWFRGFDQTVINCVAADSVDGFKWFAYQNASVHRPNFQGADPDVGGEFTAVDPRTIGLRRFEDCEAYGGWMAVGLEIWSLGNNNHTVLNDFSDPLHTNTILRFHCWHTYQICNYGYEYERVKFDTCVFRGDKNIISLNGGGAGFYSGDYVGNNISIVNCDLQGLRTGIDVGLADSNGGLLTIQDCTFKCQLNINLAPGYATGGATVVQPRRTDVRNCTFTSLGLGDFDNAPDLFIWRRNTGQGSNTNYIQTDDLYVYDYQGSAGDNFRVYATGQAGSAITPQTAGGDLGSPEAGKTNTYNLANHGVCFGGSIASCATTRSKISGYCC